MKALPLTAALFGLCVGGAGAQDFSGGGFADLRATFNSPQLAPIDGGLGTLRYGGDGQQDAHALRLADANLYGTALLTEDLLVYGDVKYDPNQHTAVDIVESYLRYRPIAMSPWRWSVKFGAFFPPISMENTGPAWSSVWTLTPSALNSWVGEELRTIGGEAKVEWRGESDHIEALAAIYGANDVAGVLLADRGWALTDRVTGLFDRLRMPNALASRAHPAPVWRTPFNEIDGRPGFYAGADWRREEWGRLNILYYDNEADPHAFAGEYAWRTRFISAGGQTEIDDVTVISQAMTGKTSINFSGDETYSTHFHTAFLLLGYRFGDWRIAARGEVFATEALDRDPGSRLSEHGRAATMGLTWRPLVYLRLTAEGIATDSWRLQRLVYGKSPEQNDRQLQLNARVSF